MQVKTHVKITGDKQVKYYFIAVKLFKAELLFWGWLAVSGKYKRKQL